MINEIFKHNEEFVKTKKYEIHKTNKYPNKKIAILSCMDTRLTLLLPAALGFKNGDVKLIKNAGAQITNPYDSVIKSLLIAVYELGVDTILVIGHDDCGVQQLEGKEIIDSMLRRGITKETIEKVNKEIDLEHYLSGFHDINKSINSTVHHIKNNPLFPNDIKIYGLIINPETGKIRYA